LGGKFNRKKKRRALASWKDNLSFLFREHFKPAEGRVLRERSIFAPRRGPGLQKVFPE